MNNITINKKRLITLLKFLLDKVDKCYYNECKKELENFKKEMGLNNE